MVGESGAVRAAAPVAAMVEGGRAWPVADFRLG